MHRFDRRRLLGGVAASSFAVAMLATGRPAFADNRPARPRAASGTDDSPRDALEALLALVPSSVATDAASGGLLFTHADLKAQFEALGIDRSERGWLDEVKLVPTTISLALTSPLFRFAKVEVVEETLGFVPLEVDRALETGVPPEMLSIIQGGFDRERMEAAWETSGYEAVSLDDGDVTMWTKGEDGEFDLKDPLGAVGAGAFNNLLLLDDQTLVIARMGAVVRDVARHAALGRDAEGSSLLGMPQVGEVVRSLLPTTASSILLPGMALVPRTVGSSGVRGDGPEMPAAAMAAFGMEAGFLGRAGDDSSDPILPGDTPEDEVKRAQVRLAMRSESDAEAGVEIAAERWETLDSLVNGTPYRELMLLLDAEVSDDEPTVAAFDFDAGVAGNRVFQLAMALDLLPFAPGSI